MKVPHHAGGKPPHHQQHPPAKAPKPPPPKPPRHKRPVKPKPPAKAKKKPVQKKPRQLSPGSDVACCSAEALGTLLGWDRGQVLELYWQTANDPDSGASILDTLNGAQVLAACFPFGCHRSLPSAAGPDHRQFYGAVQAPQQSLILGVTLPEPHAVAVMPDGTWWSWGELFNPDDWPDLVIEEVWCLW